MTREEIIKGELIDMLDELRDIETDVANGVVEVRQDPEGVAHNVAVAIGSIENVLSDGFDGSI